MPPKTMPWSPSPQPSTANRKEPQMSTGRSIRLCLVDGTPNGLLTAEIMNWTGHVLTGPRSKLSELVQRPEAGRTGTYFPVGADPDHSAKQLACRRESADAGTPPK